jgi:hypothetical protein
MRARSYAHDDSPLQVFGDTAVDRMTAVLALAGAVDGGTGLGPGAEEPADTVAAIVAGWSAYDPSLVHDALEWAHTLLEEGWEDDDSGLCMERAVIVLSAAARLLDRDGR